MKLNRTQASELNAALDQKGLKTKHVSGENYIKLLNTKKHLKNNLTTLAEGETELIKEFGGYQDGNGFVFEDKVKKKEFLEKMVEIQKAFSIELDLNFIPENELKEYCKEQDTAIEAILFEYLLKL